MYQRYLQCWRILFLLLFLTYTDCLCYIWDVRPYASSLVFLFNHYYYLLCILGYLSLTFTIFSHHHHDVVLVARISLTLSRHFSLSFIASGRSSGQHPVSSHSCWMYVRAGRPAFARPCVGVHKSTSHISNGYRRRNWTRRHEFKSWTDCISHSTNTLGEGMNPIILPPAMGK